MEKIFKAKRLDNGEWVEFNLFDGVSKITWEIYDKNTICQYAGINDIEGNRMFEGDQVDTWEYGYNCGGMGDRMVKKIIGFKDGAFTNCLDRRNGVTLTGHNIHDRG